MWKRFYLFCALRLVVSVSFLYADVVLSNQDYQELVTIMEQLQILTEKQDNKLNEQQEIIDSLQMQNNELQIQNNELQELSQSKQKQLNEQQEIIDSLQKTIKQSQSSYKEEKKSSMLTNLWIDLILTVLGFLLGGILI